MIDFHNHILPGADDGPKSMDVTLNMLKTALNQGITTIINTIHFQHPKMEGKNTDYEYVKNLRDTVLQEANNQSIKINIKLAAEVYYLPNLCELIDNPLLTINNYMLVEFPMVIVPENYLDTFFDLRLKGITPILAHPERYRCFQEDIDNLQKCIDMGIILQIDAGSIIGHFGKRTKNIAYKMLSKGYCHIIGSDSHNDAKRNFCLKEAYDLIGSYNNKIVNQLKRNSELLIGEEEELTQIKVNMGSGFSIFKGLI